MESSHMRGYQTYDVGQVASILQAANIQVWSDSESELIVFCPWHSNYRTPAGEVSKETGQYFCFSCKKTASLEGFIMASTSLSYFQALRLIEKYKTESLDIELMLKPKKEECYVDEDLIDRLHNTLIDSNDGRAYVKKRGISKETVNKFNLGFSIKQQSITIPFMTPDGQHYLGFEARSIVGKRFLCHGAKSHTIFGIQNHKWDDSIILVESSIDAMLLDQYGVAAVSSMGSNHSKQQIEILNKYFNTIMIMQDNDNANNDFAGQVAAKKLCEKLGGRGIIVKPPEQFKDVGEMPQDELKAFVSELNNPVERI